MEAQFFFACNKEMPDIQPAIVFLSTRVKDPGKDDYSKLNFLIQYLNITQDIRLIPRADDTNIIKWYIAASHAVHNYMREHTGVTLHTGKCIIISKYTKKKLNTKISTESELVGIYYGMENVLLKNRF